MWVSIWPTLAQPEGTDWFRHLDSLLPIILVVLVGLLTLVKRAVEVILNKRRQSRRQHDPSTFEGRRTVHPETQKPEVTVLEEMRRYFEILEGRQSAQKPDVPPAARPPAHPLPAQPRRSIAPPLSPPREVPAAGPARPPTTNELFSLPSGAELISDAADRVEAISSKALRKGLRPKFRSLGAGISVSHAELARGSGPAQRRRRALDRIALRRDRGSLRAAFLWREILGKPRHQRPM